MSAIYGRGLALHELVLERGFGTGQPVAQSGQRFLAAVQEPRLVGRRQRLGAVPRDGRERGARLQRRGGNQLVVLARRRLGQREQLRHNIAVALGHGHDRARPGPLAGDHGGQELGGADGHPRLVGADLGADLVVRRAGFELGLGHTRLQLGGILRRVAGVDSAGNLLEDPAELRIDQHGGVRRGSAGGRGRGRGRGLAGLGGHAAARDGGSGQYGETAPELRRRCRAVRGHGSVLGRLLRLGRGDCGARARRPASSAAARPVVLARGGREHGAPRDLPPWNLRCRSRRRSWA